MKPYCRWIYSAFVLFALSGCETTPVVSYETKTVYVPVEKAIDKDLLKPCVVQYQYPQTDKLIIDEALERLHAAEDALALCANQIEVIQAKQPSAPKNSQ